ncbi:diacylglycerol/lipid kinase family protein [Ideonella sp. BN130291]|uniref:diacylglycerol/lipid kinase family protein n=1 Tax=Ideonella sp. BN130291 TaxID=3112940 RepID=UPI002E26F19D|nr:diacylglycerol kinase family protein [Ideonella sp. BN130291]
MLPTALAPQAPFIVLLNADSGHEDAGEAREAIASVLRAADRPHRFVALERGRPIAELARQAAREAAAQGGAIVAAGGDGTVNAVAAAAHESRCVMGVVPQGTFNYFARTHHIPEGTAEAAQLLVAGRPRPVQVGRVNERLFLVNASLGLYPELLEDREAFKQRLGRSRLVALLSALWTLTRQARQLRLEIQPADGRPGMRVITPSLFVGNNRLQLEQVGLPEAGGVTRGRVAGVMLRPVGTLALLRLMLSGAFGRLGEAEDVMHFEFERLVVNAGPRHGSRRLKVAADGEVLWMRAPIVFEVAHEPLCLITP